MLLFVRPTRAAIADSWFPRDERRTAAILFWTPLLLPFVPALIKSISLLSLWNTPALNLLPVHAARLAARRSCRASRCSASPRVVTALTLLIVVASPVVGFVILKSGVENDAAYARLVMQAAEREWRADDRQAAAS